MLSDCWKEIYLPLNGKISILYLCGSENRAKINLITQIQIHFYNSQCCQPNHCNWVNTQLQWNKPNLPRWAGHFKSLCYQQQHWFCPWFTSSTFWVNLALIKPKNKINLFCLLQRAYFSSENKDQQIILLTFCMKQTSLRIFSVTQHHSLSMLIIKE